MSSYSHHLKNNEGVNAAVTYRLPLTGVRSLLIKTLKAIFFNTGNSLRGIFVASQSVHHWCMWHRPGSVIYSKIKCRQWLTIILLYCLLQALPGSVMAQKDSLVVIQQDTTVLNNVTVSAFASNTKWKEVPAAIAVINQQQLHRLDNGSLVPVINAVAGVRMEERSPGSYRLSIRGSLLRSPFGIRNVRLYWNDIPFTDAGGNTYLQLVDLNQLSSVEIIKGPASSLYGANTGGAVILHPGFSTAQKNAFDAGISGGSFGLFNEHIGWSYNSNKFHSTLQQSHLQSDGYRQQSSMRRDAFKWNSEWDINSKVKLSALLFYTDLHYKTPGGLTKAQMDSLPSLARPIAVMQNAAVYNKTLFSGITLASAIASHFDNTTTLTLSHTNFQNPFITNYEKRNEWNYGARTSFSYHIEKNTFQLRWLAGAEWQQNYSRIDNYDNNAGVAGDVQYKDVLYATQYFVFTQLNITAGRFNMQAGLSNNKQLLKYKSNTDTQYKNYTHVNTNSLLAPRLSILYKLNVGLSLYAIAARGFSPPTLAEVHPGDGNFYNIQPERGWNYEAGLKGFALHTRLEFDASFYYFSLKNAIVRRLNSAGNEYFVNAGSTIQKGVEIWLKAHVIKSNTGFIRQLDISNSFSYQPYKFDDYQLVSNIYSGNRLTGVPRSINVSSVDIETDKNLYATVSINATGKIPLTDANDVYASHYELLQAKLGYKKQYAHLLLDVFVVADNLFNQVYSLGNDINAMGGRDFNPAAKRNFVAGCVIHL